MKVNFKEIWLQILAIIKICYLKPNSWREIILGLIFIILAPLIILMCIISNIEKKDKTSLNNKDNEKNYWILE